MNLNSLSIVFWTWTSESSIRHDKSFSHHLHTSIKYKHKNFFLLEGEPYAAIRLLHCNMNVMGLKYRNNLFTCGGMTVYIWPPPGLAMAGVSCIGSPFSYFKLSSNNCSKYKWDPMVNIQILSLLKFSISSNSLLTFFELGYCIFNRWEININTISCHI